MILFLSFLFVPPIALVCWLQSWGEDDFSSPFYALTFAAFNLLWVVLVLFLMFGR